MSDSDEAHSSQEDSVDLEDPTSMSPEVLHVALQRSNADRARLKRKLAIVEDDLVTLRGAKAKIDIPSGRGIPKLVSLYETIDDDMVPEADRRTLKRPDPKFDALNEAEKQIVQRTRDRTFTGYKLLIRLIPGLVDRLCDETVDEVALAALFKQLHSQARDSRGDDVRRMKGSSAKWINEQQPTPDPLLSPDHRRNRGIEHPVCGRLLCPAHHDWDDPIVRARVQLQEEGYRLSESFFVACFYKEYECDKNDVEKGFLQSSLLVFGFRDIFTGPKSVDAPVVDEIDAPVEGAHKRSRRGGVAGLLKMDEVTPRSIAYVACLLHFNLTNASEWSEEYYGVNYHAMYDFIVDYFEDPGSEEAKTHVNNLLRWWNRQIFPSHAKPTPNNSRQILEEQRRRRQQNA